MTPDIVDGMGTAGTQGVFQRCAEETLRVLREGSDIILTVLEVFKHDPLHSWTMSDQKMRKIQGNDTVNHAENMSAPQSTFDPRPLGINISMTSGSVDEAADRALTSVARKLEKTLSVEYTINELIAEATDSSNLANMYWGTFFSA